MLKIIWSRDRLIFNMGIPIPGKDGLYIETGPRVLEAYMEGAGLNIYDTHRWNNAKGT